MAGLCRDAGGGRSGSRAGGRIYRRACEGGIINVPVATTAIGACSAFALGGGGRPFPASSWVSLCPPRSPLPWRSLPFSFCFSCRRLCASHKPLLPCHFSLSRLSPGESACAVVRISLDSASPAAGCSRGAARLGGGGWTVPLAERFGCRYIGCPGGRGFAFSLGSSGRIGPVAPQGVEVLFSALLFEIVVCLEGICGRSGCCFHDFRIFCISAPRGSWFDRVHR